MKKDKVLKFRVPIYNCDIIYILSGNFIKSGRKQGTYINPDSEGNMGLCKASGEYTSTYLILVDHKHKNDWSTIAHEVLHAVNLILGGRGVKCGVNNDEAQAYLMSYIIEKIQKNKKG